MSSIAGCKLVYESRSNPAPKPKRKGHQRVTFIDQTGKRRVFLTVGIRTLKDGSLSGPLDQYVCTTCGYAYGTMRSTDKQCSECRLERIAEEAKALERAGIPLGWGYTPKLSDMSPWSRGQYEYRNQSVDIPTVAK